MPALLQPSLASKEGSTVTVKKTARWVVQAHASVFSLHWD